MPELSVHLITYNNEAHIEATLQSILKQKINFSYEIVVGDDCSTDNTYNIVKEYAKKEPQLFKINRNEKQLGILKNFKTTLDRCSGNYVFDIAGDDLFKEQYSLQKLVDTLKNNTSLGFVDSGYDIMNNDTNKRISFTNKKFIVANKEDYKINILLGNIVPLGMCFNKELLYKYVDFKVYINKGISIDDYPILVDLIMNCDFERINESLHTYRVHNTSYSHEKDFEKLLFQKKQMKSLFNLFTEKYNFSKSIQSNFNNAHHKTLVFLAGYFEDKSLGKEVFYKIKSKNLKDWIHYLSSQHRLFRKLISFRKKFI